MDEQRFAVPEATTPGVHSAAECRDGRLRCCDVVLLAIFISLVPAALVVMVMLVVVSSVAAALAWTHTGHSAQRAGELPPRSTAGRLRPETCRSAITAPWWRRNIINISGVSVITVANFSGINGFIKKQLDGNICAFPRNPCVRTFWRCEGGGGGLKQIIDPLHHLH